MVHAAAAADCTASRRPVLCTEADLVHTMETIPRLLGVQITRLVRGRALHPASMPGVYRLLNDVYFCPTCVDHRGAQPSCKYETPPSRAPLPHPPSMAFGRTSDKPVTRLLRFQSGIRLIDSRLKTADHDRSGGRRHRVAPSFSPVLRTQINP
jgi:hypothetical protein